MRSGASRVCPPRRWCATTGLGLTDALTPDLAGFDLDAFLALRKPADSIFVRHTVGLVDAIMRADTQGHRLDDGLPESLEEVIAAYGHRYFKLKVGGQVEADIERLAQIASVLDRAAEPYHVTLDGNEQYENVDAVIALWRRMGEDKRLARLKASLLLIEQPITRAQGFERTDPRFGARHPGRDRRIRFGFRRVSARPRSRLSRHFGQVL